MNRKCLLFSLMAALFLLVSVACGGSAPLFSLSATPTSTPRPTSTHTPTPIPTPTYTPTPIPTIVGNWEGDYNGDVITMRFDSDGHFQTFISGVDAGAGTYQIDYSISPANLNLNYDDGFDILTIIEFPDYDTMRMANAYSDDRRPTDFGDSALLHRVTP